MNFRDFSREVAALADIHPLADVNCSGIRNECGVGVLIEIDETDTERELQNEKEDNKRLRDEVDELEAKIEKLEADAEKTAEVMAAIKGKTPAESLAIYLQRAEEAEADAEQARENSRLWQRSRDEAERECKALRKRKGVAAGVVREAHEVTSLLYYISTAAIEHLPRYREQCSKLLARINA